MRHRKVNKKLKRNLGPRTALIKTLADQVILFEKINTTLVKAKLIRPYVERLVTKAKNPTLANIRLLRTRLKTVNAVSKLTKDLGVRFKDTNGGYLRIIKIGPRKGDAGIRARIEFVK